MTSRKEVKSLHAMRFDTFEEYVKNKIITSINANDLKRLNENPYEWDDIYIQMTLNMYADLCETYYFNVVYVDGLLLEPIILYVSADDKISENPAVVHAVSRLFMKNVFSRINTTHVDKCKKNTLEFVPPGVFTRTNLEFALTDEPKLSVTLTNILTRFYLIAEHAAYHFHRFKEFKDCDFTHAHIHDKPTSTRPKQFYQLISTAPNKKLINFTENHKVLRRDDGEHSHGFVNDFNSLFRTKESLSAVEEIEDSSSDEATT